MLTSEVSRHLERRYQPEHRNTTSALAESVAGHALYSRRGEPIGYYFDAWSDQRSLVLAGSGAIGFEASLQLLEKIVAVWQGASPAPWSEVGGPALRNGAYLILSVDVDTVFMERFQRLLVGVAQRADCDGARVCIAVSAGAILSVHDLRLLRQVLYTLSDHGVEFVLRDPVLSEESGSGISAIERATRFVSVTPDWLGIGSERKGFDHSLYIARVTRMSNAIHQYGKTVVLEGVSNDWQASFVSSLPISYFSRSQSDDGVLI